MVEDHIGILTQAEKETFCKEWEEMRKLLLPKIDLIRNLGLCSIETQYYKAEKRKKEKEAGKTRITISEVTKSEWNATCERLRKLFRKKFSIKVWERAIDRAREVKV